jgi:hypothetical protein
VQYTSPVLITFGPGIPSSPHSYYGMWSQIPVFETALPEGVQIGSMIGFAQQAATTARQ